MTIWPARLSEDGTRVLCGWTVDGRQTCGGQIAVVERDWLGEHVAFDPAYVQTVPQAPGDPLRLAPSTYTGHKVADGRKPRPRRLATATDGTPVAVWHRWLLPAEAPCLRCGRTNAILANTLVSGRHKG
jgi:hypothetical protein